MTAYVEQLTTFASAHAAWAYVAIFAVALLEAVPVFGSIVPGATIILALGALIGQGELHLIPAVACAFSGAMLGDGVAFFVGHRKQRDILQAWPLSRYPGIVEQSETFFNRYGTLAVFLARFVGPIRAIVPVTAGALGMPPIRFYPVSGVAVLTWAFAHLLPGTLAGTLLERFGGWTGLGASAKHYWMPLILAGGVLAGVIVWAMRRWRGINVPLPKKRLAKRA